jgi:hypothetical protein
LDIAVADLSQENLELRERISSLEEDAAWKLAIIRHCFRAVRELTVENDRLDSKRDRDAELVHLRMVVDTLIDENSRLQAYIATLEERAA